MRPILLLCLLLATPAWGSGYQSVDEIRQAALSTLDTGTEGEVTLDRGLRMPTCTDTLLARSTGTSTVEVSCPVAGGWRLFVPIKIRREQDVLLLLRGISAGEIISAADIGRVRRDTARIVGAVLADPQAAVGRVARRSLAAGSLLSATDLVAQRLVRRGDSVALVSRRGGVEVRMAGRAMGDAGEHERVSVENLSSRRIVQGVVAAGGDVLVSR